MIEEKVYCKDCKYYELFNTHIGWYTIPESRCSYPIGSDTWFEHVEYADPKERNKHNNCKYFSRKCGK